MNRLLTEPNAMVGSGAHMSRESYPLMQRLFEYAAVVLWMIVMISLVHTLLSPRLTETDLRAMDHAVNVPVAAFNLVADLVLLLLVLPRFSHLAKLFINLRPLALFAILAVVSALWSINPSFTLRRGGYFLGTIVAACYFGDRYSVAENSRILVGTIVSLMLLSIAAYAVNPSLVLDVSHPGQWMGLCEHKNIFGQFIAYTICTLLLVDLGSWKGLRLPLLALSTIMLFLSHSTASWMLTAAILMLMPLFFAIQKTKTLKAPLAMLVAAAGLAMYAFTSSWTTTILQMFGKDPTLTGRTELWQSLLVAIAQRPLLGYGFEAFFSNTSHLVGLQAHATWLPPHAHNGYLQVALGTGLLGFSLAIWFIVSYLATSIRYAQRLQTPSSLVPLVGGMFWILHNSVEVTLLQGQTLLPFIIFIMYASMKTRPVAVASTLDQHRRPDGVLGGKVVARVRPGGGYTGLTNSAFMSAAPVAERRIIQ